MNNFHHALAFVQDSHRTGNSDLTFICAAVGLLSLVGIAQTFSKAGKPRWGILIPIYNVVLFLQIAQRPIWWFLLLLVPGVNVVVAIILSVDIARLFGRGTGFGWGLAFLGFVFYPILGFGDAVYLPAAAHDPSDSSSPARYFPKVGAATKQQFKELGVSLINNFQGRGLTVGIGRGSAISSDHLPDLIPLGLNELYLSRTKLGDESLASLEAMRQLRVLDLSNTKVSRDGIRRLKAALPQTEIIG